MASKSKIFLALSVTCMCLLEPQASPPAPSLPCSKHITALTRYLYQISVLFMGSSCMHVCDYDYCMAPLLHSPRLANGWAPEIFPGGLSHTAANKEVINDNTYAYCKYLIFKYSICGKYISHHILSLSLSLSLSGHLPKSCSIIPSSLTTSSRVSRPMATPFSPALSLLSSAAPLSPYLHPMTTSS